LKCRLFEKALAMNMIKVLAQKQLSNSKLPRGLRFTIRNTNLWTDVSDIGKNHSNVVDKTRLRNLPPIALQEDEVHAPKADLDN